MKESILFLLGLVAKSASDPNEAITAKAYIEALSKDPAPGVPKSSPDKTGK